MLAAASAGCERMTWTVVILLALAYVVLSVRIAFWLGGLLRDAEVFLREPCACRKGAICAGCLAESEAIRPKPQQKEAA